MNSIKTISFFLVQGSRVGDRKYVKIIFTTVIYKFINVRKKLKLNEILEKRQLKMTNVTSVNLHNCQSSRVHDSRKVPPC